MLEAYSAAQAPERILVGIANEHVSQDRVRAFLVRSLGSAWLDSDVAICTASDGRAWYVGSRYCIDCRRIHCRLVEVLPGGEFALVAQAE
jgi:hypothetical protein